MIYLQLYWQIVSGFSLFVYFDLKNYFALCFIFLVLSILIGKFIRKIKEATKLTTIRPILFIFVLVALILGMIRNEFAIITSNILITSILWGVLYRGKIKLKAITLLSLTFFILFTFTNQLFNGYSRYYFVPIIFTNGYLQNISSRVTSVIDGEDYSVPNYIVANVDGKSDSPYFHTPFIGFPILVIIPIRILHFFSKALVIISFGYLLKKLLPTIPEDKYSSYYFAGVFTFFCVMYLL